MKRYKFSSVTAQDLNAANRLLQLGWRPVREVPVAGRDGAANGILVVLERDDEAPVFASDVLPGGMSLLELGQVPLFSGCTGAEVRAIVAACSFVSYETDDVLFAEGQVSSALYVILSGRVEIRLPQLDEIQTDETLLLAAGPRDVFGESSFFARAPHRTTATALSPVSALQLHREAYDDLLQAQCLAAFKLSVNLATLLASRLQATDLWAWDLLREQRSAGLTRSWTRCFGQRIGEIPDPTLEFLRSVGDESCRSAQSSLS
jgi:CRP-like cAMP-binding protein